MYDLLTIQCAYLSELVHCMGFFKISRIRVYFFTHCIMVLHGGMRINRGWELTTSSQAEGNATDRATHQTHYPRIVIRLSIIWLNHFKSDT